MADSKTFRLGVKVAKPETSSKSSRTLSDSASSWLNRRHLHGRVEDLLTQHRHGWIGHLLQPTPRLFDSALPWLNWRRDFDRAKDFSTQYHHGRIGDVVVDSKTFRLGIVMADSNTSPRQSRTLSNSASSWLNPKHRHGQVEDLPT